METKNKNKSINRISFIIALFFALAQAGHANVVLGASISAGEMIRLTNESRAEAELPFLLVNEKLTEAAMEKADDMFEFQYFDHNSPSGSTPWDFIRSAGYDYIYAGENLAIDFVTANGAHRALMESASHRENILNSNYTEIGIVAIEGIFDGNKSIIIVEEFGTPLKKETVADYDLNENVELILEEKVNEINNLKDDDEKEKESEEFSQIGLPAGQAGSTQACLPDRQEYGTSGLEEESVNEQNDDLSLGNLNNGFDVCSLALYQKGDGFSVGTGLQPVSKYFPYTLNKMILQNERNELQTRSSDSSAIIEHNPILLAGDMNNEKVMGLVNKAYAKDEHIKKYDYQQNPVGSAVNRYFQKEFIESVLSFYAILAVLLVLDLVIMLSVVLRRYDEESRVYAHRTF